MVLQGAMEDKIAKETRTAVRGKERRTEEKIAKETRGSTTGRGKERRGAMEDNIAKETRGPYMVVVNPDDDWFVEQAVLREKKSPAPGGWSSEDYEDDYYNDCFVDGSFYDFG